MAKKVTGSLSKVALDGISFNAAGDANVSWTVTVYENSMVATSGRSMQKKVKRVPEMSGVVLIIDHDENDKLRALAESLDEITLSVEFIDGTEAKSKGVFEYESYESEEGRASLKLLPSDDWTIIVG